MSTLTVCACTGVLLLLDYLLFGVGRSWTPIHYESLAPLLALSIRNTRLRWLSALSGTLLFGSIALLFFVFGLTSTLASESWLLVVSAFAAGFAWLLPGAINSWLHQRPPTVFLLVFLALLGSDKLIGRDMLLSSYTPHFFQQQTGLRPTPSDNLVYSSLNARLVQGKGAVLIVFESLGVPEDKDVIRQLQSEFPDFVFATNSFEGGSTLPAEVRYLCGVNGTITNYGGCLPHGVRSRAIHGNSLSYFGRNLIYPAMGFQEAEGRHELANLQVCRYSYTAICDVAIWERLISNVLSSGCSEFNYMLSIDSHFPYTKYPHHVEGLYSDLRELLIRMRHLRQKIPDCPIYIAGDHPPPLARGFESHQVLMVSSK